MEFGEIITLDFLTLCCVIVIPIAGFSVLGFIRFSLQDKILARNIFITIIISIIISATLLLLYMGYNILSIIFTLPQCCPGSSGLDNFNWSVMIMIALNFAIGATIASIIIGFIIAYDIVVPITLIVRYIKKKSKAHTSFLKEEQKAEQKTEKQS